MRPCCIGHMAGHATPNMQMNLSTTGCNFSAHRLNIDGRLHVNDTETSQSLNLTNKQVVCLQYFPLDIF